MPNYNAFLNKTKSFILNKKFLLIIFLVSLFLAVALYVYNGYIAPKINPDFVPNREFTSEDDNKMVDIYLFTADWCRHSDKAKPEWDKVKKLWNGKKRNNYQINFIELDGDKNDSEIDNFEAEYLIPTGKNIDGYPSIWLVKDNEVVEFDAKVTKDNLLEFIQTLI